MMHLFRQFTTLAETCNYRKASELLNISQPALTKNIKKIENEFGCQLFERSNRGCSLTSSGRIFLKYINRFNSDMKLLRNELEKDMATKKTITMAFGNMWLVLYASKIILKIEEELNDNIIITARRGSSWNVIHDILSGDCDIFLGNILNNSDPRLVFKPLMQTHHCIFAKRDHPLFNIRDSKITLDDFAKYKWLILGSSDSLKGNIIPNMLKQIISNNEICGMDSLFVILEILQNSDALILMPWQVGQQLIKYDIVQVDNHSIQFPEYTTGIIFREEMLDKSGFSEIINIISNFFISPDSIKF